MKLLHTVGYDDQPFSVPVDRILAVSPYVCQRHVLMGEDEKTPGARITMQDASENGTAFIVRETYESIIAKLEDM
jgi:hypothetical protein